MELQHQQKGDSFLSASMNHSVGLQVEEILGFGLLQRIATGIA